MFLHNEVFNFLKVLASGTNNNKDVNFNIDLEMRPSRMESSTRLTLLPNMRKQKNLRRNALRIIGN